ncbi:MAG TPA: hypothetical protein PKY70_01325 [Nakamurella multipartita]|nr:hypothetical protein [Nakamurella multipartita]
MIGPIGRGLPWQAVRAVLLAVITVGFSVAAHGAAGGAVPTVGALALLTGLSAVVALPILLRWRSPAALVPLLTATQGALHPAFGVLSGGSAGVHDAHAADLSAAGAPGSVAMLAAHLAAGLVAAALVVLVDRLLRAAYLGRCALPRPPRPAPPAVRRVAGPVRARPAWVAVAAELRHSAPRRGPPLLLSS